MVLPARGLRILASSFATPYVNSFCITVYLGLIDQLLTSLAQYYSLASKYGISSNIIALHDITHKQNSVYKQVSCVQTAIFEKLLRFE